MKGRWWGPPKWSSLSTQLSPIVYTLLNNLREMILVLDRQVKALQVQLTQSAPKSLPKGLGQLTCVQLDREMCDWKRLKNRRKIGSSTGLCAREYSSGGKKRQGSINKQGSGQLPCLLVKCAWRLLKYQPKYKPVQKYYDNPSSEF